MGSKRKLKNEEEGLSPTTIEKKKLKKEKKEKKKKKDKTSKAQNDFSSLGPSNLPFDYKYIVAPMVGASELPFRLLCRKYGSQLIYTPMMLASEFATSEEYRKKEFQTTPFDRPLVCHFAANDPVSFAKAAQLAEPYCDAIDLNLGCPQRTAYVGHFGSYLLDKKDRDLVVSIIQAAVKAVKIPIFVKIRLLDTYEDTLELVRQIYGAGATLIAVHARYRATFHRKGPGARDGPALLDQVQKLKEEFPDKLLITNGNTITYDDVVDNLNSTKADGIMSAEGILDNPALYLSRLGSREDDAEKIVKVKGGNVFSQFPERKKWLKKLEKIHSIEEKQAKSGLDLTEKEKKVVSKKKKAQRKLAKLDDEAMNGEDGDGKMSYSTTTLEQLYNSSDDKVSLALEYIDLVRQYPAVLRTVIFHTRRILKTELTTYQLMNECLKCATVDEVEAIVLKIQGYEKDPSSFSYDVEKAKQEKEALERKKQEEGKRKNYEARMIRKAKREGRDDLEYYLRQGAVVPTLETVAEMKKMTKEEQLKLWKEREHSQHCMSFHLNGGECPRARGCAFLHVSSSTTTTFDEKDEVAG